MNRSNLFFAVIAALLIGGLAGLSIQTQEPTVPADANKIAPSSVTENAGLNYRLIDPKGFTVQHDEFGRPAPATTGENFIAAKKTFKHETLTINLALDGSIEYKAEMEQGDSIVYRWIVKNGAVYYDFHGHPGNEDSEFFTRYSEGEGPEDSGSIVASYKGQHGWYWLNIADQPVILELEVAGFYDKIISVSTEY